jgi:hypothetical protein
MFENVVCGREEGGRSETNGASRARLLNLAMLLSLCGSTSPHLGRAIPSCN